jgi:hypothetical protein
MNIAEEKGKESVTIINCVSVSVNFNIMIKISLLFTLLGLSLRIQRQTSM